MLVDFLSKYVWSSLIKIVFLQKPIKYKDDSHTDSVLGLAWNKEYRFVELKLDSAFIFSVGCFLEPKSLYTHTHTLVNGYLLIFLWNTNKMRIKLFLEDLYLFLFMCYGYINISLSGSLSISKASWP